MQYRKLGQSDLEVSSLSLGCMSLPHQNDNGINIIGAAVEGGINLFDTADLYDQGANELMLGKALKPWRQQVMIATKVGNRWRPDGSGWDWAADKAHILSAVEESLRRLQTDYIDLYQLHGGTIEDPIDEIIEAFELLLEEGKIRAYGISSIRPNVIREYVSRSNISSVMMQYSLFDRRPEESCFALLRDHHIGVLARGALAKGLLNRKPPRPYLDLSTKEVATAQQALDAIATEGYSNLDLALGFVYAQKAVTSAVVGVSSIKQLEGVLAAPENNLATKTLKQLHSTFAPSFYKQHR